LEIRCNISFDLVIDFASYNPEKVICVGLNYLDHAKETNMAIPSEPVLFSKFSSSIIGPNDKIIKPREVTELDYEAELVLVIGKAGKRIPESEAMQYHLILSDKMTVLYT
jgi:2-keto-4-pentenoate hydratase/2-oxohepta-3-ene-1,7-dioic acid hydratase in catechol pathway